MTQDKHRARSIEELNVILGRTFGADVRGEPYLPRPSDVIIAPYSKCGTTMLQQMFHQLRTAHRGGDMGFDDISRVVPWIEIAPLLDLDINSDQLAEPRGFKSHLHYAGLPEGARYVVSLRDPGEAFVSMYHFFSGWLFEPGSISLEDFLPVWLRTDNGRVTYYGHLLSWWERRDEEDTLLLDYRNVIAQKRKAVRALAEFCGIEADEPAVDLVEHRTSRAYMVEHKAPFADPMIRAMSERRGGLPPGSRNSKVRAEHAERVSLSPELEETLDAIWQREVASVTKHAEYASLAAELALS